jgi:hypothetical protein
MEIKLSFENIKTLMYKSLKIYTLTHLLYYTLRFNYNIMQLVLDNFSRCSNTSTINCYELTIKCIKELGCTNVILISF